MRRALVPALLFLFLLGLPLLVLALFLYCLVGSLRDAWKVLTGTPY